MPPDAGSFPTGLLPRRPIDNEREENLARYSFILLMPMVVAVLPALIGLWLVVPLRS